MRLALLSALAVVILASVAAAETVGRFGVSAMLPKGYTLGPPPGNDDGRLFSYPDGTEIRLWGSWVMDSLTVDRGDSRAYYRGLGAEISYDTGGADWYVLSGYLGNSIFYLRVEEGRTCGGETALAHIELLYPADLRDYYDDRIGPIARSLGFGPC